MMAHYLPIWIWRSACLREIFLRMEFQFLRIIINNKGEQIMKKRTMEVDMLIDAPCAQFIAKVVQRLNSAVKA